MKHILLVLMTVCSRNQAFGAGSNGCNSLYQSSEMIEPKSNDTLQNDTLEFVLKNGYIIQWVSAEGDVVVPWNNDKYESVNRRKKIRLISMYEQLGDTTNLNIYVPYKNTGPLRIGDLVLILLMHSSEGEKITKLYGGYLHWLDCPVWGYELFDWIEEDRENIVKKLCKKYRDDTSLFPK